jgi:hypothetical protein
MSEDEHVWFVTNLNIQMFSRILVATGFEPAFELSVASHFAARLGLERGYRNVPVLDDETLAWQLQVGAESNVYVSGVLAEGTVGPIARNIVGAKRAGERIAHALTVRQTVDSGDRTSGRPVTDD